MKPQDVIKQLAGDIEGWDEHDTGVWSLYKCSHHNGADCGINLQHGLFEVLDADGKVIKQMAIKAELVEITD